MGQGPSSPGPPGTKFQVIGAGMSRTGTKTFATCITTLLGPVHDGGAHSLGGSRTNRQKWLAIMKLKAEGSTIADDARIKYHLAQLMEGYVATCDLPGCYCVKELLELYPDAIVIATTREKNSWWRSVQLMESLVDRWWCPIVAFPIPAIGDIWKWMPLQRRLGEQMNDGKRWTPDTLEHFNELLKQQVPPEKLFFYDVRDGWEPLCKILGLPVPDVPFPHVNDPNEGKKVQRALFWTGLGLWAFYGAALVALTASAYQNIHRLPRVSIQYK